MSDQSELIRERARQLLAEKSVERVIGYSVGSDGTNARPFFATSPEDAAGLVFDETCTHNLVTYLNSFARRGRSAVVVKPCDARALNVLIQEKQIGAGDVVPIDVRCSGIVLRTREDGDGVALQARCAACEDRADVPGGAGPAAATAPFSRVVEFERLSAAEREAFWTAEFERCIRCYACRQVCPACYCDECFAERLDPEWVGIRIGESESWMFHAIRAFHLAGRCVGCDECERVCPVGIPLGLLNGKLRKDVLESFNYRAGVSSEQIAPLSSFRKDERLEAG